MLETLPELTFIDILTKLAQITQGHIPKVISKHFMNLSDSIFAAFTQQYSISEDDLGRKCEFNVPNNFRKLIFLLETIFFIKRLIIRLKGWPLKFTPSYIALLVSSDLI